MLIHGDSLKKMTELLEPDSVDAVIADPPYGIGFMGHEWDQPGEHGALRGNGRPRAFGSDEDRRERERQAARDKREGVPPGQRRNRQPAPSGYTTGVPGKGGSMEAGRYDLSLTANRRFQEWCEAWSSEALRVLKPGGFLLSFGGTRTYHRLVCGVEDAGFEIRDRFWSPAGEIDGELAWIFGSGFPKSRNVGLELGHDSRTAIGTALKPAHEPIVVARKPLSESNLIANLRRHATGGLNIDACLIDVDEHQGVTEGRWPANVILDEHAAAELDAQSGLLSSGTGNVRRESGADRSGNTSAAYGAESRPAGSSMVSYGDSGGASRFFYCAKTSRAERNAGLEGFEAQPLNWSNGDENPGSFQREGTEKEARNYHPTVKPISLMRWLVRLVVPEGGLVLDPFLGSGTTAIAALLESRRYVGIERREDYLRIAEARIAFWREHGEDGLRIVAERDAAAKERERLVEMGQLDMLAEMTA